MSRTGAEIQQAGDEEAGLPVLATRANEAHRSAGDAARSALEYAREAGEALNAAKEQIEHGGWTDWVEEHFDASLRTAQRYQRIADRWEELTSGGANAPRVADLTLRAADQRLSDGGEEAGESSSARSADEDEKPAEGARRGTRSEERPEAEGEDAPDRDDDSSDDFDRVLAGAPDRNGAGEDEPASERFGGAPTTLVGRYRRLAEFCRAHDPEAVAASADDSTARDVLADARTVAEWNDAFRRVLRE